MSAVEMSIDNVGRQCGSLVSAVNAGPCVASLTGFSHSVTYCCLWCLYGMVIIIIIIITKRIYKAHFRRMPQMVTVSWE